MRSASRSSLKAASLSEATAMPPAPLILETPGNRLPDGHQDHHPAESPYLRTVLDGVERIAGLCRIRGGTSSGEGQSASNLDGTTCLPGKPVGPVSHIMPTDQPAGSPAAPMPRRGVPYRSSASSMASSIKRSSMAVNESPAAAAAWGKRLVAVMPGMVLVSRT